MYFWKVDKLVGDLRTNKVTQKEELKYIIAYTICLAIAMDLSLFTDASFSMLEAVFSVVGILVNAYGVYYCYQMNSRGDDKQFISRFFCLSWPITIRIYVFCMPFMAVILFLLYCLIGNENSEYEANVATIVEAGLMFLFTIVYYLYLGKKFKAVSSNELNGVRSEAD